MATLDIYEQERLFDRPIALYPHWENSAMSLKGVKHVIDVRCFALIGAIEMAPRPGETRRKGVLKPAKHCYDNGAWVRAIGDSLVLSPPLIISEAEITDIFTIIHDAIEGDGITLTLLRGTTMDIAGKHIVITGAASGIGRAMAQRFHAEGAAKLFLVDLNEAP